MREQTAVNMLLRAIGSNTINSLASLHPDAVNARAALNRVRERIQKRGYWFNIDYGVTFEPDQFTKEITIPQEITTIIFNDSSLVQRGGKLYDKVRNTYQFTGSVTAVRTVRILEWDDMAASCQEYCAFLACAEFVRDELEDANKENSMRTSAGEAKILFDKEELEQGQYNVFNSTRTARARNGVRPYVGAFRRGKNFG